MRWVSEHDGDGAGYDILSFDAATGDRRLIEVNATCGEASREHRDAFRLYPVFDLAVRPRIFELRPPLNDAVHLETATWRARFG